MTTRQEKIERRTYLLGPTKLHRIDWDSADGSQLVNINDVTAHTRLSKTAIGHRIKTGTFPKPSLDGKRRVWTVAQIRRWCRAITSESESDVCWLALVGGSTGHE